MTESTTTPPGPEALNDDLIVVGAGWTGLFAAALAAEWGARVRLVAQGIGALVLMPGWVSVLESAPGDLAQAIRALAAQHPEHPYALAGPKALAESLAFFRSLSARLGLPYTGDLAGNRPVFAALGSTGALQYPALVPAGYAASGVATDGQSDETAPLWVGFAAWRDYFPALSGAHSLPIALPPGGQPWDLSPTQLARRFDLAENRAGAAAQIKQGLRNRRAVRAVGMPAVLGLEDPQAALDDLSQRIGLPVFEIPTLPPSVPGTRLFGRLRRHLLDRGVRVQIGHPVVRGLVAGNRVTGVEVAAAGKPQLFRARCVLLATGGLYGGGLASDDRGRIWEPIFGLPVQHETDRARWFGETLLADHAVRYVGLRVNERMQPIGPANQDVLYEGLYAAGHLLSHPAGGPSPLETYEGVSLATAYRAVANALGRQR